MRKKYIRALIALTVSIICTLFIFNIASKGNKIEYEEILVASKNIKKFETVNSSNTKKVKVPKSEVVENSLKELPEGDIYSVHDIRKNQIIYENFLEESIIKYDNESRSYPLSVTLENIGKINKGDLVDIYSILFLNDDSPESIKILSEIKVEAVLNKDGKECSEEEYKPSVVLLVLNEEQINSLNEVLVLGDFKIVKHY